MRAGLHFVCLVEKSDNNSGRFDIGNIIDNLETIMMLWEVPSGNNKSVTRVKNQRNELYKLFDVDCFNYDEIIVILVSSSIVTHWAVLYISLTRTCRSCRRLQLNWSIAFSFLLAELNIRIWTISNKSGDQQVSQSVRGVILSCVIVIFLLMLVTKTQTLNLINICLISTRTINYFYDLWPEILKT